MKKKLILLLAVFSYFYANASMDSTIYTREEIVYSLISPNGEKIAKDVKSLADIVNKSKYFGNGINIVWIEYKTGLKNGIIATVSFLDESDKLRTVVVVKGIKHSVKNSLKYIYNVDKNTYTYTCYGPFCCTPTVTVGGSQTMIGCGCDETGQCTLGIIDDPQFPMVN